MGLLWPDASSARITEKQKITKNIPIVAKVAPFFSFNFLL